MLMASAVNVLCHKVCPNLRTLAASLSLSPVLQNPAGSKIFQAAHEASPLLGRPAKLNYCHPLKVRYTLP